MNDAGLKMNDIEVVQGVVFFDVRAKADDVYRVGVRAAAFSYGAIPWRG